MAKGQVEGMMVHSRHFDASREVSVNLGQLAIYDLAYFPTHGKLQVSFAPTCFSRDDDIKAQVVIDLGKLWKTTIQSKAP